MNELLMDIASQGETQTWGSIEKGAALLPLTVRLQIEVRTRGSKSIEVWERTDAARTHPELGPDDFKPYTLKYNVVQDGRVLTNKSFDFEFSEYDPVARVVTFHPVSLTRSDWLYRNLPRFGFEPKPSPVEIAPVD